jgi:LytS/YehU family sensor histidine kinase
VRSSVDEDWEQAISESYSFTIRRPWWKNSWFSVGIGILIALILFMIVKMRFKNIRKKEALAREKVQSQFDTLRNQINPHFLFNSFNTLNSIIQHDQQAAVAYVEKLSDYFRIVLEQREKDVITVREELSLVESYLFLQKRRFGDNLNVDIQLSSKTMNSLIPPMALQLLTENAIKHNVISRNKPLQISIYEKGGNIAVSNSVQLKPTKEPSTGIGLDNISHRYRLLFKKDITTESNTNTFKVSLPIIGNLDSN